MLAKMVIMENDDNRTNYFTLHRYTLVLWASLFTNRKGMERHRDSTCSVGLQLTYARLCFIAHALRFVVTH